MSVQYNSTDFYYNVEMVANVPNGVLYVVFCLTGEKKWILIGRIIPSQHFRDKFQSLPWYVRLRLSALTLFRFQQFSLAAFWLSLSTPTVGLLLSMWNIKYCPTISCHHTEAQASQWLLMVNCMFWSFCSPVTIYSKKVRKLN